MGGSGAQPDVARGIAEVVPGRARSRGARPAAFRRTRALRLVRLLVVTSLVSVALACAGGSLIPWEGGGVRHRVHGFGVGAPPLSDPPWRVARLEGADLAYQRGAGEWMSLHASCKRPQAEPRILARHLRIGVGRYVVRSEGAVEHRGLSGWQQTFDVGDERGAVRVRTVTLVDGRCTIDFVFSGGGEGGEAERDFDRWWRGYEPRPQEIPAS